MEPPEPLIHGVETAFIELLQEHWIEVFFWYFSLWPEPLIVLWLFFFDFFLQFLHERLKTLKFHVNMGATLAPFEAAQRQTVAVLLRNLLLKQKVSLDFFSCKPANKKNNLQKEKFEP